MKYDFKEWLKASCVRAIKTFAQTMLSMITVGMAISEVDWAYIASCSARVFSASVSCISPPLPGS